MNVCTYMYVCTHVLLMILIMSYAMNTCVILSQDCACAAQTQPANNRHARARAGTLPIAGFVRSAADDPRRRALQGDSTAIPLRTTAGRHRVRVANGYLPKYLLELSINTPELLLSRPNLGVAGAGGSFGYPSAIYKVVDRADSQIYALRR